MKVVYPGSFDPPTYGHLDVIRRASLLFEEVHVCLLHNSSKKSSLFSVEERVNMLKEVVGDIPNVFVDFYDGLLIDYVKEREIGAIIRGLREITDFGEELRMAQANRSFSGGIETLFLAADPTHSFISSSMVREFASYGKTVEQFVPEPVLMKIEEKLIG